MAEKSGSDETPIELRQKIARSRELVVRDMGALRYELNFQRKFKQAFQRHTVVWVGAALALGLFVALLRARPQKIYVNPAGKKIRPPNKTLLESGVLLGILKLGLNLAQPYITNYVKGRMAGNAPESRPGRYR